MSTRMMVDVPPVQPLRERDPRRCGAWLLLGRIGAGGMGTVYLGQHADTGRRAAVKVMSDALADQPGFRDRFAREIRILQQIHGPFVAAVLDGDARNEMPWLATEYFPGPDLARLVRETGAIDEGSWVGLAAGLVSALDRLHRSGVVHRDVKPANILLSAEGPRLIDFGIARLADGTALTSTGAALGTPGWLAPEQFRGGAAVEATDCFAAGAVLAYAATGRPPFGSDTTPAAALHSVLHHEPDLAGVPPAWRDLLSGLLAKDQARRWSIERALSELVGGAAPHMIEECAGRLWRASSLSAHLAAADDPAERYLATRTTGVLPGQQDTVRSEAADRTRRPLHVPGSGAASTAQPTRRRRRRRTTAWIAGFASLALVAAGGAYAGGYIDPADLIGLAQGDGRSVAGSADSGPSPDPTGDSADAPASRTVTSNQADQQAPSEPVATEPLTYQDLTSAPVPAMCRHEPGSLQNGERDFGTRGSERLVQAAFGPMEGQGSQNAAAVLYCNAGGVSWPNVIALYRSTGGRPVLVDHVDLGDVTPAEHSEVSDITLANGRLSLSWKRYEGACFDMAEVEADIRLVGGRAVVENLDVGPTLKSAC